MLVSPDGRLTDDLPWSPSAPNLGAMWSLATKLAVSQNSKDSSNTNYISPGRLAKPGHENIGRWSEEEHESFLAAFQMHGKQWQKVAAAVETRTVIQVRSHAQKYWSKLGMNQWNHGSGFKDETKTPPQTCSETN